MKKYRVLRRAINLFCFLLLIPALSFAGQISGTVQFVTNGFKLMQVVDDKGEIYLFKFGKNSKFSNAKSLRSFIPNDMVKVSFGKTKNIIKVTAIEKIPRTGGISIAEFKKFQSSGGLVIDVRKAGDKRLKKYGILKNAINIPLNKLEKNLNRIPKDKKAVLYCNTGVIATFAYNLLKKNGYDNVSFVNAPFPEIK